MTNSQLDNLHLNHEAEMSIYRARWHHGMSLCLIGGAFIVCAAALTFYGIPHFAPAIPKIIAGALAAVGFFMNVLPGVANITSASRDMAAARRSFNKQASAIGRRKGSRHAAGNSIASYSSAGFSYTPVGAPQFALA